MAPMDVVKALQEHSEAGALIVDLLYGSAGEDVSKALVEFGKAARTPDQERKRQEKIQGRVAAASNVVGIGAGAAATPGAIAAVRPAFRAARGKPELPAGRLARKVGGLKAVKVLKKPKVAAGLAAGGAALQVGNLGGDFVTNRVLSRSNKNLSKSVDAEMEIYTEISKLDLDKRQVFGWASVTSVNGRPVVDLQGDQIELDEIEKAAYSFVEKSRKGGNMHQKTDDGPLHVSDMIESMVITPEKREAMGLPDSVPDGWWVGFKVNDDKTWDEAKAGRLAGFSIHGSGKRVPLDA